MIYRCYTVRDLKARAYAPPFFIARDEVAIRTFSDALAEPGHPMAAHPADYELFHVGEFDDETGAFTPIQPRFLTNGNGEPING